MQLTNSDSPIPPTTPASFDQVGVYRNGNTFFDVNKNGYEGEKSISFGLPGDKPTAGDWNGDGKDEIGVYRNGWFFLDAGAPGYNGEQPIQFGLPGDLPIAGDWNGDGKDEVGVYRKGWFFLDTGLPGYNGEQPIQFGLPGDLPIAGDWNGDGKDEVGVYRNGWFFLDEGPAGFNGELPFQFGLPGDKPIAGDWDHDGKDAVGVFRGGDVYFDTGKNGYEGELPFQFGLPGDLPVAGNWAKSVDSAIASLFAPAPQTPEKPTTSTRVQQVSNATTNPIVTVTSGSAQQLAKKVDADKLELSFVDVQYGVKVEFDPLGRLKDGQTAGQSIRVNLKVDAIAGRTNNNPTTFDIRLRWSTSASSKDIVGDPVFKSVTINRSKVRSGDVIPVYFQSSKMTQQPGSATHLIAEIVRNAQLLAEESNGNDNIASQAITSPAMLANQILGTAQQGKINLADSHLTIPLDNATAKANITQVANGQLAQRSLTGANSRAGATELDPRLLAAIVELSKTFKMTISEIAGGVHTFQRTSHDNGLSFDVSALNGSKITRNSSVTNKFQTLARSLGATATLEGAHLHIVWNPRPARAGLS